MLLPADEKIKQFNVFDASVWKLDGKRFICQDTLTRRQQSGLCGLRVKLPPVTTSLTTQR